MEGGGRVEGIEWVEGWNEVEGVGLWKGRRNRMGWKSGRNRMGWKG